jgi:hypothetical protein
MPVFTYAPSSVHQTSCALHLCHVPVLCCAVRAVVVLLLPQLVDEAYSRWLEEEDGVVDDITAVVVKLLHPEAQP